MILWRIPRKIPVQAMKEKPPYEKISVHVC
jgi:hypothetical protein